MPRVEHMIRKLWQQSAIHFNEISISDVSLLVALIGFLASSYDCSPNKVFFVCLCHDVRVYLFQGLAWTRCFCQAFCLTLGLYASSHPYQDSICLCP